MTEIIFQFFLFGNPPLSENLLCEHFVNFVFLLKSGTMIIIMMMIFHKIENEDAKILWGFFLLQRSTNLSHNTSYSIC